MYLDTQFSQDSTSRDTYEQLKSELGKEFVDKTLIHILGFENTLQIAGGKEKNDCVILSSGVSVELSRLLQNTGAAITFAREKILKQNRVLFDHYFTNIITDTTSKEGIQHYIRTMIQDMVKTMDIKTIEAIYYEFMLVFRFYNMLESQYPDILGKQSLREVGSPSELCATDQIFSSQLCLFLDKFYKRLQVSSREEKCLVYFISEFLRLQSGEREGIGNSMNTMVLFWTLDSLTGTSKIKNFKELILETFPGTKLYQQRKMHITLDHICREFLFKIK